MKPCFFFVQFFCLNLWMSIVPALATAADQPALNPARPEEWFTYGIILFTVLGTFVSMLLIRSALTNANWSLADALSEKVEITERKEDGTPLLDENNQPVVIKKMQPSSSRMVALMGTIAILFLFLSFGAFALFYFAQTGQLPEGIDKAVKFLTAGLTLFAPYVINKFSKSFEMLSPKR